MKQMMKSLLCYTLIAVIAISELHNYSSINGNIYTQAATLGEIKTKLSRRHYQDLCTNIVFFLHISTSNVVFLVNSTSPAVESLRAFDFQITEEADPNSQNLGFVRGLAIVFTGNQTLHPRQEALYVTVVYNDTVSGVSGTLIHHGLFDSSFSGGPTVVSVVGGTGDFTFAKGSSMASFVSPSASGSGFVVSWNDTLCFY